METKQKSNVATRKIINRIAIGAIFAAVVLAIIPLFFILADVVIKGAPELNLTFLTQLPTPVNVPGGGVVNAIEGSFVMVGFASLISLPIGIGAGIFLSEWGEMRFATFASFTNDVLAEFPSIVIGIFVYVIIVLTTHTFSAFAGGFALAIIMIPIIARTTEESLKLVPRSLTRGFYGIRGFALADDYAGRIEHWPRRPYHWSLAVSRKSRRRNCPALAYGSRQHPCAYKSVAADCRASSADIHLRHISVQRLAGQGLGRIPGTHLGSAGLEPFSEGPNKR